MATIHTFVADIVDRIPAMSQDSPDNNRMLLENLTLEFLEEKRQEWVAEWCKYPQTNFVETIPH